MPEQNIGIGVVASILGPLLGFIGILVAFLYNGLKGDINKKQDKELCNDRHSRGGK